MKTTPTIYADLGDVLFEGRNKAYGGYQLRAKEGQNTMLALGGTMLTAIALLLLIRYGAPRPVTVSDAGIITLTEVDLPDDIYRAPETEPAAPQPSSARPATPSTTDPVPTPSPDPTPKPTPTTSVTPVTPTPSDTTAGNGSGNGPSDTPPCIDCKPCVDCKPCTDCTPGRPTLPPDEPKPWDLFTGTEPSPLNMTDVMKKVGYPTELREHGVEGKVSYRVLVDEQGRYVRHELIRTSHPLFDKQCAGKLSALRFNPGMMGDRPVKVWVTVPFRFELRK